MTSAAVTDRLLVAGLLVAGLLFAGPAVAQTVRFPSATDGGARPSPSEFWLEARAPGYRRARMLLRHALAFHESQRRAQGPNEARAYVETAIRNLRLAMRYSPDDPEIVFHLALFLSELSSAPTDQSDSADEALATFARLRALDPEFEVVRVAFELATLHTRARRFEEAVAEYERALEYVAMPDEPMSPLLGEDDGASTIHSNLAEVTMLAGDLQSAVQHYERAIELSRRTNDVTGFRISDGAQTTDELLWAGVLPLWGLAVALDRLGEHRTAVETAQDAVQAGNGTMRVLRAENVFFEPSYELHWYEALGHEARAEGLDRAGREAALRNARQSWQSFLDEGGDRSRWAAEARQNLERIEDNLGIARDDAPGPRARRPRRRADP